MKKIVPFTKDLMFKTKIGEITSIALDNTLKLNFENVTGEFIVSGTYKMLDGLKEEEFKYNIPVDITIDSKYDTKNCVVSIDDFSYEIINEEDLKVNISVMLDDLDIKEDPIEKIEVVVPDTKDETDINLERVSEDNYSLLEDEVLEDIKEIDNVSLKKELKVSEKINDDLVKPLFEDENNQKEYCIYRVYTIKEDDTIDIICDKFNTNKEILSDYNDLDNLKVGLKLIIPSQDE